MTTRAWLCQFVLAGAAVLVLTALLLPDSPYMAGYALGLTIGVFLAWRMKP